jgi:hypothetical protein
MRKTTSLLLTLGAITVCGCSSSGTFANKPSPPQPVNVTVFINDSKVSASPPEVGAGPVNFIVTNQASQSEALTILPAGSSAGQPIADTGPINPQGTAQVTVNFASKGDYTVATTTGGSTDAANATASTSIQPATLHVGKPRSGESTQLLTP